MKENELPKGFATLTYGAAIEKGFENQMREISGYERITTFASDLAIAECFGENALKETFNNVVKSWLSDVKYFTEFVMALNIATWRWFEWEGESSKLGRIYSELYYKGVDIALETFKGKDLEYYLRTTD